MRSTLFWSTAITLVTATSALAMGPRVESYRVEGYLDRAPDNVSVIDTLQIDTGDETRTLHVTASEDRSVEVCPSCDPLFDSEESFTLRGDDAEVRQIVNSPEGSKITGAFLRARQYPEILVEGIDVIDRSDGVAQGRDSEPQI